MSICQEMHTWLDVNAILQLETTVPNWKNSILYFVNSSEIRSKTTPAVRFELKKVNYHYYKLWCTVINNVFCLHMEIGYKVENPGSDPIIFCHKWVILRQLPAIVDWQNTDLCKSICVHSVRKCTDYGSEMNTLNTYGKARLGICRELYGGRKDPLDFPL
jgi:hypothetical protein